jgi:hypothetical protein
MKQTNSQLFIAGSIITALITGCGAGSAAIAGAGGTGGTTVSPPPSVGTSLEVTNNAGLGRPLISPATIHFDLTSDNAVILQFAISSGPGVQPPDSDFSSVTLVGSPQGQAGANEFLWDFAFDLGDERYRNNIVIRLDVIGEFSPADLLDVEVGNGAPIALANLSLPAGTGGEDPSGEIDLQFRLSDAAQDQVDIKVEFDIVGDTPDDGFQLARRKGLASVDSTPAFAFADFVPAVQLNIVTFAWDSAFQGDPNDPNLAPQIYETELEVQFRITIREQLIADDSSQNELVLNLGSFRVDNNTPPVATMDELAFVTGIKDRGNIPISFTVVDPTSDDVEFVVQWQVRPNNSGGTAQDLAFPALPTDLADLSDLLTNRARGDERRELQIAIEAPLNFSGQVGAITAPGATLLERNEIRLPELASSALALEFHGLLGRTLEILRSTILVEKLVWSANPFSTPFSAPVASLVLEDGSTAFVLDGMGGGWQLREVNLETGTIISGAGALTSSGGGAPIALAIDPLRGNLFVGTSTDIHRIDLASGAIVGSVSHGFATTLRGIASLSADIIIATGDNELRRIDLTMGDSTLLLTGLAEPWGIIVDPLEEDTVLVAERTADRIVSISLDELVPRALAAEADPDLVAAGSIPLPSPRNIAFDPNGSQLLVLCDNAMSNASLRTFNLRGSLESANPFVGKGEALVHEIASELDDPEAGLATGVDQIRLLTSPSMNELAISGGASQRRVIVDNLSGSPDLPFDRKRQVITLESDLDPVPPMGAIWRIAVPVKPSASASGSPFTFIWDSSEVPDAAQVAVRVTPVDTDFGGAEVGPGFRSFRGDYKLETLFLQNSCFPDTVLAVDLDDDGDLDLVTANTAPGEAFCSGSTPASLTIVTQTAPGVFATQSSILMPNGLHPLSLYAADLNGDGAYDLVTANSDDNSQSGTLTIFFQSATPGVYSSVPSSLAAGLAPESVVAADLDGDGDMDLVSADRIANVLTIFIQGPAGSFTADPTPLPTGASPASVVASDLDQDGDIDLACANSEDDSLTVYFQTSTGTFTVDPNSPYATGVEPGSVLAVDLNGDGAQDLVAANQNEDSLTIFLQEAPGVFVDTMNPTPTGGGLDSIGAGDLDGDGDMDLVSVDSFGDTITLIFQTSPGVFERASQSLVSGDRPRSVALADLDGDGDIDIVGANAANTLSLFKQASAGTFTSTTLNLAGSSGMRQADMNGDGAIDLVVGNTAGNAVKILHQVAPGNFIPGPTINFPVGSSLFEFIAVDLNGDGLQDLVTSHGQSDENPQGAPHHLTLIFQLPNGVFSSGGPQLDTIDPAARLLAVDLDGDGGLDLVTLTLGGLVGFFQLPNGDFPLVPDFQLLPVDDLFGLIAVDLNGDGLVDLGATSATADQIHLYFQDAGTGFPQSAVVLTTAEKPNQLLATDLDYDGDLDLVSADSDSNRLSLFFNPGNGAFSSSADLSLQAGFDCETVVAVDLDNDRDIDLATADANSNTLTIFTQISPGVFSPNGKKLATGQDPVSILAADLDGDGDMDLANLNLDDGTISIMHNGN